MSRWPGLFPVVYKPSAVGLVLVEGDLVRKAEAGRRPRLR